MKVGFIGAGKVGVSLGKYFSVNNIQVSGFSSRSMNSSLEAANFIGTTAYEGKKDLIEVSDVVFITTPDDCIEEVWKEIRKYNLRGKLICNTSGSVASAVFEGSKAAGAYVYSIHPSFPFANKFETYKRLNEAVFSIEGDGERMDEIKKLLMLAGNKVYEIDKDKKALYHLSNVMVSNMVTSLISVGCSCLEQCGIPEEHVLDFFKPLISSNINNLLRDGFKSSMTGPIERGDAGTIEKHLKVIPAEYELIYVELSKTLLKIAKNKHPERNYNAVASVLRKEV